MVREPSVLRGVQGGTRERAAAVLARWEEVRLQEREAEGAKAEGKSRVVKAKRSGRKGRGH